MLTNIPRHRKILSKILRDLVTNPELKDQLGFKGGTSLFLLEGLPRFSTDLDFDCLTTNSKLSAKKIDQNIKNILEEYGELKDARIKEFTILNVVSYEAGERNIKIEVNLRDFGSRYEVREWLNLALLVMNREDQFAHKLVCLTDRDFLAGRDVFDTAFMFRENWEINDSIVEERTGISLPVYLKQKILPVVNHTSPEEIMQDVGELVQDNPNSQKWIKNRLLDDLEFAIRNYLQEYT